MEEGYIVLTRWFPYRTLWTASRRRTSGTSIGELLWLTRRAETSDTLCSDRRRSGGCRLPKCLSLVYRRSRGKGFSISANVPVKFSKRPWQLMAKFFLKWKFLTCTWSPFPRSVLPGFHLDRQRSCTYSSLLDYCW